MADRGDANLRLDRALARRATVVSGMSRTRAQAWIDGGLVVVDGIPARRASITLREGASVVVKLPPTTRLREIPGAEPLPLEILYEDELLLAVNKPAGMVVHPSFRNTSGTLLNAVLWRYQDRPGVRPGLTSRLDKDTSGVLLLALSPGVHAEMQRQARIGYVRKEYVTIVRGRPRPEAGTIRLPLGHDPSDRRRIVVRNDGLPSETRYRVVSQADDYAFVVCELVTGRTHQIRVHMAAMGWPVAGDEKYGTGDATISRQALHAWRLVFPHPGSGKSLELEAPLPADLKQFGPDVDLNAGACPPPAHGQRQGILVSRG